MNSANNATPTAPASQKRAVQLIRAKEILEMLSIGRTAFYEITTDKSRKFPQPIYMGSRTPFWVEAEVVAWIEAKMEKRAAGKVGVR